MKSKKEILPFDEETGAEAPENEDDNILKMLQKTVVRIYNLENRMAALEDILKERDKREPPQKPQKPVPAWQQQPVQTQQPAKPEKKQGNKKALLIIIVIAVAIFLLLNYQAIMSYFGT